MRKILMCTGEENTFDNEMTMFKNLNSDIEIIHSEMFANESKLHKILRNMGPIFIKNEINPKLKENIKKFDTIILFECVVKNFAIRYIRKQNPNMRIIIYFRNQFSYSKKRNINLEYLKKLGCEFWSYHLNDCKKLGFNYNSQFWNAEFQKKVPISDKNEISCLFLGRIKNRIDNVIEIHNIVTDYGLNDYIYLVPKTEYDFDKNVDNKYMDYTSYLKLLSKSKAVIDLVNSENLGLTVRPLEAMFYKKKLITNYLDIVKYDFYDPNNVFILGIDNIEKLPNFINGEYKDVDSNICSKYDFSNWIKNFFE